MGATLAKKVWTDHVVKREENGTSDFLFIGPQLVHEMANPQAFEELRLVGRPVRRPDLTVVTGDHSTLTLNVGLPTADFTSCAQIEALHRNYEEFNVPTYSSSNADQGIIHVIGPQLGLTQPSITVVCGGSHTSIHGASDSLALEIGTSKVKHVLTVQTPPLTSFKMMTTNVDGRLKPGTTAKNVILVIVMKIRTNGAQSHIIEYCGEIIHSLSMEARMMVYNTSVKADARAGAVAPGETTFTYVGGRPNAPGSWDEAIAYQRTLATDDDIEFDIVAEPGADELKPLATWGANPDQGVGVSGKVPKSTDIADETQYKATEGAIEYMGLTPGTPMRKVDIGAVFIGSRTNGHIEDLRITAKVIGGRRKTSEARTMVVLGSARVHLQTEAEGLDKVFLNLGTEWRNAGCSMCLGINPD